MQRWRIPSQQGPGGRIPYRAGVAIRMSTCDFRRFGRLLLAGAFFLFLSGAGPESSPPTVSAEIGVRAQVVAPGANPILSESDNEHISNNLRDLIQRATLGRGAVEELESGGAVIRVEALPPKDESTPVELLVEYVGN